MEAADLGGGLISVVFDGGLDIWRGGGGGGGDEH